MRRLIHQLPAQLTTKRDLLLGASILTGFIWVFNLPGISGDLAGWARWLHWVHRHNWLIFVFAFVAWVSVTAWLVLEMRSRPASSVDRKQAATYLALGRHQERAGKAGVVWELDEVKPTQASFRLRPASSAAELRAKLRPYLQQGLEILRKEAQGVDRQLLDRATEKWLDGVRALLESDHPDFALHYTIPTHSIRPRSEGQSRRVRQLTQRLSWFLKRLETEGHGDGKPSPRDQAAELLAECKRLISEAWEGQPELSKEHGSGDVESVNALFRKARPILAKHYPDEMHRLDYDVPDGASAEQVGKALSNVLPAFHNFQKKYPS